MAEPGPVESLTIAVLEGRRPMTDLLALLVRRASMLANDPAHPELRAEALATRDYMLDRLRQLS